MSDFEELSDFLNSSPDFVEAVKASRFFVPIELAMLILARKAYDKDIQDWDAFADFTNIHVYVAMYNYLHRCNVSLLTSNDLKMLTWKICHSMNNPPGGNWNGIEIHGNGKCQYPECTNTDDLQKDHIWPKSLGGPYEAWNGQLLCGFHNRMKSNKLVLAKLTDPTFIRSLKNFATTH